jgi:hypothetical protein
VQFKTTSADQDLYAQGDTVEFYDAWDTLWFRGTVTSKTPGASDCLFIAEDTSRELARPMADIDAKMSTALTTITGSLSHGYTGTIQDVDYAAGAVDYHFSTVHSDWQPFLRLFRALERSVVWITPAGAWNTDHYDDCDSLGYRWKAKLGLNVALKDDAYHVADSRITRASCAIRSNSANYYIGNAAREVTEGVVAAPDHADDGIQVSADAIDTAEQLYAIFSTATTFAHVYVTNWGFIQEGKTVDFSWSVGNTVIARTTLIVLAVHANMLSDVQELVLSNNIVLEPEMDNLSLLDES